MPGEKSPIQDIASFKEQLRTHQRDCGFFRAVKEKCLLQFASQPHELIKIYKSMVSEVRKQIDELKRLSAIAQTYKEYKYELKPQIDGDLERQNKRIKDIESQITLNQDLVFLFSLRSTYSLVDAASSNKHHALLIIQTPELFKKMTNESLHQLFPIKDTQVAKALAEALASREYNNLLASVFASLKQEVNNETDRQFITTQEDKLISALLCKVNDYLDKKIDASLQQNMPPWALGYFGSRYKINKNTTQVAVPQGIHKLKELLDQRNKVPPSKILGDIQTLIHTKQAETQDNSILKQILDFISYLFGCNRTQDTVDEYEKLGSTMLPRSNS